MQNIEDPISRIDFHPAIERYIFWSTALILFISFFCIPFGIVWLLGFGQHYSKRYVRNLECELSDQVLRFQKGSFFQTEKTIPLDKIQDLTMVSGPLLRRFNLTIIRIETAGKSQNNLSEMTLIGIKDPIAFKNDLLKRRNRNHKMDSSERNPLNLIHSTLASIEKILDSRLPR